MTAAAFAPGDRVRWLLAGTVGCYDYGTVRQVAGIDVYVSWDDGGERGPAGFIDGRKGRGLTMAERLPVRRGGLT